MIINGRDTRKNSLNNTNEKDLSYYRSLLPQKTIQEKADDLWVDSTAPNVLEKKNVEVKPLNIRQFVNDVKTNSAPKVLKDQEITPVDIKSFISDVKNSPEAQAARITAESKELEKQKEKDEKFLKI